MSIIITGLICTVTQSSESTREAAKFVVKMMKEKDNLKIKHHIDELTDEGRDEKRFLVLHNDDVHTFDYVIDSLIEVCDLEIVQAEQCTYLVHYKGKCDVKKGTFRFLKPLRQGLTDRGLNATID